MLIIFTISIIWVIIILIVSYCVVRDFKLAIKNCYFTKTRVNFTLSLLFLIMLSTSVLSAYFISLKIINPFLLVTFFVIFVRRVSYDFLVTINDKPPIALWLLIVLTLPVTYALFFIVLEKCVSATVAVIMFYNYIVVAIKFIVMSFLFFIPILFYQLFIFTVLIRFLLKNDRFWICNKFYLMLFRPLNIIYEFTFLILKYFSIFRHNIFLKKYINFLIWTHKTILKLSKFSHIKRLIESIKVENEQLITLLKKFDVKYDNLN